MNWSYTDPSTIPKDAVRLAIGDTDEKKPLLFDEELQLFLDTNNGQVSAAAFVAVEAIIAKLSRLCDQSVGSVSKSYSQVRDGYYKLRDNLKTRAAYRGGIPIAGGISVTDEMMQNRDRDRIAPMYTTRMMAPRRRYAGYGAVSGGVLTGAGVIESNEYDPGDV